MYELSKKTISTLIMTILMLSMALSAMPMASASNVLTIHCGTEFEAWNDATVGWATDPATDGTKGYVAKLYQAGSDDYAFVRVYPASTITLNTLTALNMPTFKYYMETSCQPPALELHFEQAGGIGYVDVTVFAYGPAPPYPSPAWPKTADIWYDTADTANKLTMSHYAVAYGVTSAGGSIAIETGSNPLSAVITAIKSQDTTAANWVLTRVTPQVGGEPAQTVYIDDVKVGTVTYDLEPSDHVGDKMIVAGTSKTLGGLVKVYWDSVKDWDGTAGYLAETYAVGTSYSVEITIPETKNGNHYVIVKDIEASVTTSQSVTVDSKTALSPTAGIVGDTITVTGTGFAKATLVGMKLLSVKGEKVGIGDGTIKVFSLGFASTATPTVYVNGVVTAVTWDAITPDKITFASAPASGAVITADYTFSTPITLTVFPYGLETSSLGSFTATFAIPTIRDGKYAVQSTAGVSATSTLTVGIVITLTPKRGLPGTTVTVAGRGFKPSRTVDIIWTIAPGYDLLLVNDYTTDAYGEFTVTITVPLVTTGKAYTVKAIDTVDSTITASATFTVTGTTAITISLKSGLPGIPIDVTGEWFTGGKKVTVYFDDVSVGSKTASTSMPYGFTALTITIPATATYGAHTIKAMDSEGVYATATFTVSERKTVLETRSTTYMPGDTISFNIYSTVEFKIKTAGPPIVYEDIVIKIGDPDGYLFWSVKWKPEENVATDTWVVPYSAQTDGTIHLTLPNDAMAGLWKWNATYYLKDVATKIVKSGSFTVKAVTASMIDEKITALEESINLLGVQILAAQTAAEAAQAAADAAGTKATAAETAAKAATTAAQAAQTAATAAQTAATAAGTKADAALTAAQAATTAAQGAKTSADSGTTAANAAKASADAAKAATDGLTTMVYVSIAASLIAALAAIFAVMQIGKKIA